MAKEPLIGKIETLNVLNVHQRAKSHQNPPECIVGPSGQRAGFGVQLCPAWMLWVLLLFERSYRFQRKRPAFQVKCLDVVTFTHDQEGVLRES